MADINVDRIIKDEERLRALKKVWFELSKTMFRNYAYYQVLNILFKAAQESLQKEPKQNKKRLGKFIKSAARKIIDKEHTISSIAEEHGIKIKGDKMVCPFHEDKDPSLSFSDEKGVFNCFGCHAKGDIVEFKRRLITEKIGNKKTS